MGACFGPKWPPVGPFGPPEKSAFNYEKGPFEPQFHETAVVELNRGAAYF